MLRSRNWENTNSFLNQVVLLYDGVCGLCNRVVQFTLAHDRARVFGFAALQNDYGQTALKIFDLPADAINTVVLIEDGRALTRSSAAFRVMSLLGWPWRAVGRMRVLPHVFTDRVYMFIARHRYAWFGKFDVCQIPTAETRARFLD